MKREKEFKTYWFDDLTAVLREGQDQSGVKDNSGVKDFILVHVLFKNILYLCVYNALRIKCNPQFMNLKSIINRILMYNATSNFTYTSGCFSLCCHTAQII